MFLRVLDLEDRDLESTEDKLNEALEELDEYWIVDVRLDLGVSWVIILYSQRKPK